MPELQARTRLHDTILCRNRLRRLAGCLATIGRAEARPDGLMTGCHAAAASTAREYCSRTDAQATSDNCYQPNDVR